MFQKAILGLTISISFLRQTFSEKPPNLIVIITDEHNIRTLGCYRSRMSNPFVWGEGVKVNTPHIDSLAKDGALFTNFNTVAPLCTPSRASFMTGLYPRFTGAYHNHFPLDQDAVTFAELLQKNAGYFTGYIGKWHLNGEEKPGFANENRPFGFDDIKYQFNRGHWKFFEEKKGNIYVREWNYRKKLDSKMEDAYATDFLFNKAIKFIDTQIKRDQHYALMLSIPDPHGPNQVRPPYDSMFNHFDFKLPMTGVAAYNKKPANPGWSSIATELQRADEIIEDIENDEKWQTSFRNYFGMVKLIDDKVGELLSLLKERGQDENTIVVFTSDHGDMMGEHGKYNKGRPYQGAAAVPFVIRYPGHIKKGKIVNTSYSSPDFTPTILSIMGIDHSDTIFQGIDGSDEFLNDSIWSNREQIRFITDSKQNKWVASVDRQYKLVLSGGAPFLFDLYKDPNELINFYGDPNYNDITDKLQKALFDGITKYKLALADFEAIYFDRPTCLDTKDQIPDLPYRVCADLETNQYKENCNIKEIGNFCSDVCGICCEDSLGLIWYERNLKSCNDFKRNSNIHCRVNKIAKFCPVMCSKCLPEPSERPSSFPTFSVIPTETPSIFPTSSTPSFLPTKISSASPSEAPSNFPSVAPSIFPTTAAPSIIPTKITKFPSATPSFPSISPTSVPTAEPSIIPTEAPSNSPNPTSIPSIFPTVLPTSLPTAEPSVIPTAEPSVIPTMESSEYAEQ